VALLAGAGLLQGGHVALQARDLAVQPRALRDVLGLLVSRRLQRMSTTSSV
jgi:hypothetical protein